MGVALYHRPRAEDVTLDDLTVASLLVNGNKAKCIEVTGTASSAQIYLGGTARLASGEQALYLNFPLETVATNGIWITLKSTIVTGDLTGIRSRVYGNAASAGASVRGGYFESKMAAASKYAAMLEGSLSVADYSAGTATTISGDVRGSTSFISNGTGLSCANLYGHLIHIQTLSDETVTTNDVGLRICNEAVNGAGRQMDSAIQLAQTNVSASAFGYGIDMAGIVGKVATADIRLNYGETIKNTTDGLVEISDEGLDFGFEVLG